MGCDRSWVQVISERALIVVLVGNIGKFSLAARQPGQGLSLQTKRVTMMILAPHLRPAGDHERKSSASQEKEYEGNDL
jgi:hypothetical protein